MSSGRLYNSVLVIGADGSFLGRRRKVRVVPIPAEAWSSVGEPEGPITVDGIRAGLLIPALNSTCWTWRRACASRERSFSLLVACTPGECGPEGVWEARSEETGLTLLVCNRTGEEPTLAFLKPTAS